MFCRSYEDLMFGEDEEEERPGIKAKKKVKYWYLMSSVNTVEQLTGYGRINEVKSTCVRVCFLNRPHFATKMPQNAKPSHIS